MAAVFPASLPFVSVFENFRPAGQRAATSPPGAVAQRARTGDAWATARIGWVFRTDAQRATFETWFATLGGGFALIKLPITPNSGNPVAPCYSAVKFPNGYETPFRYRGMWRCMADVVIRDRFECALPACYIENFNFTAYAGVSGEGLAQFERIDTAYGPAMRAKGDTSPVDNTILRTLYPGAPMRTASVKFLTETAAADNAYIALTTLAGAWVCTVMPRIDSLYDGAQRCWLFMDADAVAVSPAALAIGVWYQLDVTTAAGAGASSYVLTRLDTAAVVQSGAVPGEHGGIQLVRHVVFVEDGNTGTPPTQFADLRICP
jgi:hypothetical protein